MEMNEFLFKLNEACDKMPNIIFTWYLENGEKNKHFYELLAECYKDIQSYCVLMNNSCWTQAGMVLRLCIDQVSTFIVLVKNVYLIDDYVNLFEEYKKYQLLSGQEKKNLKISKNEINKYFSYSWISSLVDGKYGRDQLLELADLGELKDEIKDIYNKFSHGVLSIFNFSGGNKPWDLMRRQGKRMNATCIGLFQRLYVYTIKYFKNAQYELPIEYMFEQSQYFYPAFK